MGGGGWGVGGVGGWGSYETQIRFKRSLSFRRFKYKRCLGLFFSSPARFQTDGKLKSGSLLRVANL